MASKVSGYIGKINPGNGTQYSLGSTAYGYCETAAATAAKTVDMTGFILTEGATIFIKFKYNNTATDDPTLNVNSTGAKPLIPKTWYAGAILSLTYDGTSWIQANAYLDVSVITTGTLPTARGGTGATSYRINSVIVGSATPTETGGTVASQLSWVPSASGALYATETNGTPQFGTLPVAQGGTGNTSYDANRMIYSESAAKLSASGHYASSDKIAINSTSIPNENFYVNGTTYLNGDAELGDLCSLSRIGHGGNWNAASTRSMIRVTTASGWSPLWVQKAHSGWWTMGHWEYSNNYDHLIFGFLNDADVYGVSGAQNHLDYKVRLIPTIYNADTTTTTERAFVTSPYTSSSAAVGSSTQPVYIDSNGVATAITGAIANSTTGNAATATRIAGNLGAITANDEHNIWVSSTPSADGIPKYISGVTINSSTKTITATTFKGNLTGNATNVTGTVAIANGGTGATTAANARTNLGALAAVSATGISYTGMATPDGDASSWIRVPSTGLIPYEPGGAGNGHSRLGTTNWRFASAYIETVYGNLSGNATNVTGTVAIANGGTGATTRLAAAKNLTNESVPTPTHVVGLTTSWAKFGYTTIAQLRTALGSPQTEIISYTGNGTTTNSSITFSFAPDVIIVLSPTGGQYGWWPTGRYVDGVQVYDMCVSSSKVVMAQVPTTATYVPLSTKWDWGEGQWLYFGYPNPNLTDTCLQHQKTNSGKTYKLIAANTTLISALNIFNASGFTYYVLGIKL